MFKNYVGKAPKEYKKFNDLIRFAQQYNENQLLRLEQSGYCLSTFKGIYTPVMWLAQQNDCKAVDMLLYKFKASSNHAVEGYARGGHKDSVNALLKAGASALYAIRGYAWKGCIEEVEALRAAYPNSQMSKFALQGYAQGGHTNQVKDLSLPHLQELIVQGYAEGGHVIPVNELITIKTRHHAIRGYAIGGFVELALALLDDKTKYLQFFCYAYNGQIERVNSLQLECNLIEKEIYALHALIGYSQAGYLKQIKELIHNTGASVQTALKNLASFCHIQQVNRLAKHETLATSIIWGFKQSDSLKGDLLPLLSFIDNPTLRMQLAESLMIDTPLRLDLYKKATCINKNMKKYQLDFRLTLHLLKQRAEFWLVESAQLIEQRSIPAELIENISSFFLGLSNQDTRKVILAVMKKRFLEKITYHFNNTSHFFSPLKPENKRSSASLAYADEAEVLTHATKISKTWHKTSQINMQVKQKRQVIIKQLRLSPS